MKPTLTLFTNGYEGTWPAIEYATWVAKSMQTSLTLVGVSEETDEQHPLEDIFGRAVSLFQTNGITYELELAEGPAEKVIVERTEHPAGQLFVFGPFGRPQLKRMVLGRSFRHILADVISPVLYIPVTRIPLKKVLVCLGGLGYAVTAEQLALDVARMNKASVTFLHVVPPIELDYPEARKIRENWEHLAESDTLPGQKLRDGLQRASEMGLPADVRVRNGNIVEEILAEIKEGEYDLVCMGSPYSAQGLRHLYMPNVTADVAESASCPILSARFEDHLD